MIILQQAININLKLDWALDLSVFRHIMLLGSYTGSSVKVGLKMSPALSNK
jgi:hypothetical protein